MDYVFGIELVFSCGGAPNGTQQLVLLYMFPCVTKAI